MLTTPYATIVIQCISRRYYGILIRCYNLSSCSGVLVPSSFLDGQHVIASFVNADYLQAPMSIIEGPTFIRHILLEYLPHLVSPVVDGASPIITKRP